MPPIIGITATLKEDVDAVAERPLGRFVRADLDYVEGVAGAGGAPVVLPPAGDERAAEAVIQSLDGLLLSGGSDLDPHYYGEEPMPELGVTLPERDAFEMALVGLALRRGIPVFGICRGMQVLNVALGGTLYQDLPSQWERDLLKHRQDTPKWQPTHEVRVRDGSYIAEVMGRESVKVNSYHHQGVRALAEGLVVTGRSSDGVVEAVEAVDLSERWLLGVQWHAEAMRGAGPQQERLFEAHVSAAERHALRRAAA
ncbi:MAG: gamma-glutamyl-gamma-aminobutyrate hydrolase family protein [Actinomycetota bacterium]|nr:gamma-glutamyl-gamma-aminobutyrate hydrolase family protein [Actinomycetota bacterium]MDQ3498199.1 gamma-glutamyl-gamma-aminobutyrate hydrolase family protein [Actinomycetota bacterium]MDQ3603084.1 gamma-glutamyl-gamma-aminobutyrate hydrolase family protein [Actinomycetota bacterium]